MSCLTLYLIEASFNTFVSIADPDQAALVGAAWSQSTLLAGNMIIYDSSKMDMTKEKNFK